MIAPAEHSLLEWGVAEWALQSGASGDRAVVAMHPAGALVAVIDGLGHGPEAAFAAAEAAAILQAHRAEPVSDLVRRCHQGLRTTRGAVMSLVSFRDSWLSWVGVGNVEAVLLRGDFGPGVDRECLVCLGGVVGDRLPPLRPTTLRVAQGDLLCLATDGVSPDFVAGLRVGREPAALAELVLSRFCKRSDDALVLVARYLGMQA